MQRKPKRAIFDDEAKDKIIAGVETAYRAVSNTFGARSNNVAIGRPFGVPSVVHDGVTVIKELLPLADADENVAAEIVAEAADKTNRVGDGTTGATILTRELTLAAHKHIAAGHRPMGIREGIEDAVGVVVGELSKLSTKIDLKDIGTVANISAQNTELGGFVAQALQEVGADGVVTVEETRTTETSLEIKAGMEYDQGMKSPYFMTDQALGEATVKDAVVLVTNHRLSSLHEFGQFMEKCAAENIKDYLIIADDIEGQALAFLAINKVQGNINVIATQAPSFAERRTDYLKDIATITGATFIDKDNGMTLDVEPKDVLGKAAAVTSTKDSTVIIGGSGAKEDIELRLTELRSKLKNPDASEFESERLQERIAKLTTGVAVVMVGAKSEPELKERKERVIDAISAAKAALSKGVVPGGGVALLTASLQLETTEFKGSPEYQAGVAIVREACKAPFRKLMENAGFDPGEMWARLEKEPMGSGVDVIDGKVKMMVEAGIIDPLSVIEASLENAASAAIMLATTNVIITEVPSEPSDGTPKR